MTCGGRGWGRGKGGLYAYALQYILKLVPGHFIIVISSITMQLLVRNFAIVQHVSYNCVYIYIYLYIYVHCSNYIRDKIVNITHSFGVHVVKILRGLKLVETIDVKRWRILLCH